MEGKLLVTPEKLQSTASSFQSKASQVQALHTNMISKVKALGGTFTGEAAEAYIAKFNALETSMNKVNSMINEHVRDLNEMASIFITATTTAKSVASELPVSTLE